MLRYVFEWFGIILLFGFIMIMCNTKFTAEDGYVITNTRKPNIPPKTPNTGDRSNQAWYLTMLGISGALLVMAGLRKKAR